MINYVEQLVEQKLAEETKVVKENVHPVPFCPPQIPYDLTWDRTWAAVVESC
jgi:hypothetical protein